MLIAVVLIWTPLDSLGWRIRRYFAFRNPAIAVLREDILAPKGSDYGPESWYRELKDNSLTTEYIAVRNVSNGYQIIINPYGEGYPEENAVTRQSFLRFEDFVYNGGIFVTIGGYSFFWALDLESGKEISPKRAEALVGKLDSKTNEIILGKAIDRESYSLYDGAILWEKFGLLVTWGNPEIVDIFQKDKDKEFAGDLIEKVKVDKIMQFRAIDMPISGCRPMLRATSKAYGEIAPLLAIPFGRGYFVIGGMDLFATRCGKTHAQAAFKFGIEGIKGIIQGIQNGSIKVHDTRSAL
jgi:hypothetical protein